MVTDNNVMMLGSKGLLTPLIPDCSALCAPAILMSFSLAQRIRSLGKGRGKKPEKTPDHFRLLPSPFSKAYLLVKLTAGKCACYSILSHVSPYRRPCRSGRHGRPCLQSCILGPGRRLCCLCRRFSDRIRDKGALRQCSP